MFELYKQTNVAPEDLPTAQQRTVTTVAESLWPQSFSVQESSQTDPLPEYQWPRGLP